MATTTPDTATVLVVNRKRDTIRFPPVFRTKDGTAPAASKKCKRCIPRQGTLCDDHGKDGDVYTLYLGSTDDREAKDEEGKPPILRPEVEVPVWAVEAYRKNSRTFQAFERTDKIAVRSRA
jgi:hypothetical protein